MLSETRNAAQHQLIGGATGSWEVVIGMEVHAQVNSKALQRITPHIPANVPPHVTDEVRKR